MSGAAITRWLATGARLLLAVMGSAVALLISALVIAMADIWFVTGQIRLPFTPPVDLPASAAYLAIAAIMVTVAVLAMATIPLLLLKRESLAAYLLLCGGLPLLLLAMPATDGEIIIFAGAAMSSGAFWWFAYRRAQRVGAAGHRVARTAWLIVLASLGAFVAAAMHDDRAEQLAVAEPAHPTPLGGTVLGQRALLYDYRGRLFDYALRTGQRQLLLDGGVADVRAAGDGSAWILAVSPLSDQPAQDASQSPGSFRLLRIRDGQMEASAAVDYGADERPWTLAIRDGAPTIIGRTAAFILDKGTSRWRKVAFDRPLSNLLQSGDATSLVATSGDTVFIGLNLGEWGGGLAKINLTTGRVNMIEQNSSGQCGEPLNHACDPVTGLVPDPDDQRCVLASVGLSHMLMFGRILRICPRSITVAFSHVLERPSQTIERAMRTALYADEGGRPDTEAFFALIRTKDGSIWAVSPFAAYRKDGTQWSRHPLPILERRGSLEMSEKLPGIVLLASLRNARNALSGATPMALAVE